MYILNLLLLIISMQICKNCLIPNIRPDQIFTKGVCNACIFFEKKKILIGSRDKKNYLKSLSS